MATWPNRPPPKGSEAPRVSLPGRVGSLEEASEGGRLELEEEEDADC